MEILEFENITKQFIERERLLHKRAPVIVALSGGADSVALLAVLSRLGYDCRAAHCNFHLRGEESMRDMRHAGDIAAKLDVDIYIRDFDVPTRMKATGESVEMACRSLRYAWFEELMDRDGAQATAVGHHREDRAETFMLNLFRGTGIAGLTSMHPRSGNVVRPLLPLSRKDIEEYISALDLSFIEDSSNASDAHRRNRLRNNIFPLIEEQFPGAMDAILRTIGNLEKMEGIFRDAVDDSIKNVTAPEGIDLAGLAEMPYADTRLFEYLKGLNFNYTQVCDMLSAAHSSGKRFHSSDGIVMAEINRGFLTVSAAADQTDEIFDVNPSHDILSPVHITVNQGDIADFHAEATGARVAYFDISALSGDARWQLRHYRRGDRMVPFGSSKSKLVSDLFANARYSASQKRDAWFLTRNDEIVWAPGLRNSAAFALGPGSKRFIRLELLS